MQHVYIFTLEIVSLHVGATYPELPPHLTLISRFESDMPAEALAECARDLFGITGPIDLSFGATTELGPKNVVAHMVSSVEERVLHERLCEVLAGLGASFRYPEFTGKNHRAHVTQRMGYDYPPGEQLLSRAAYLVEIIDGKRFVRDKFRLTGVGR